MRTIYLDSNFMCYDKPAEGRQAVETDAFDNLCAAALECYRYIPQGQEWMRPDGRITPGPFIQTVKESVDIQHQYELDEAQRWDSLGIPQEQDFTATRNYPVDAFIGIRGQLYEVIRSIPQYTSIITGQNVIKTTVEHYLDTLKEEQ